MRCPKCKFHDTKVTDTRVSVDGQVIRRRRVCLSCGYKFQTTETICVSYPNVVKRDGTEVQFLKEKLKTSVAKALSKDKQDGLEEIFKKILDEIAMVASEKISSKSIGEIVMRVLKTDDTAAYMRFASVYKEFKSADDFKSEFMSL